LSVSVIDAILSCEKYVNFVIMLSHVFILVIMASLTTAVPPFHSFEEFVEFFDFTSNDDDSGEDNVVTFVPLENNVDVNPADMFLSSSISFLPFGTVNERDEDEDEVELETKSGVVVEEVFERGGRDFFEEDDEDLEEELDEDLEEDFEDEEGEEDEDFEDEDEEDEDAEDEDSLESLKDAKSTVFVEAVNAPLEVLADANEAVVESLDQAAEQLGLDEVEILGKPLRPDIDDVPLPRNIPPGVLFLKPPTTQDDTEEFDTSEGLEREDDEEVFEVEEEDEEVEGEEEDESDEPQERVDISDQSQEDEDLSGAQESEGDEEEGGETSEQGAEEEEGGILSFLFGRRRR
jgi:hypothetical protein